MLQIKKFVTTPHTERRTVGLWQCFITSWMYRSTMLTFYSIHALLRKVLIILPVLVSNLCSLGEQLLKRNMLLRARYPNGLNLPTKNAIKVFGVAVASKRSNGVTNRHKNDDTSYVHAKERKVKQQCSECHNHVRKQHSK